MRFPIKRVSFLLHSWHTKDITVDIMKTANLSKIQKFSGSVAIFLFFAFSIFFTPSFTANAQFQQNQLTEQFSFEVYPKEPGPNEDVTIVVRSFSFEIDQSYFTWTKDGKVIEKGTGKKQTSFRTGGVGSRTLIRVLIQTPDRGSFTREITFRPANIDLIWEARTYTPPFYRGKAIATSQSPITIVAIPEFIAPNGKKIAPENLIYTWKKGSRILGSKSGRGKHSITLPSASFFNSLNISVTVSSLSPILTAKKSVSIKSEEPYAITYEDHPTKGILLNYAISDSFKLKNEEISFVAMPFFFTGNSRGDANLEYVWKINGKQADTSGGDPSSITLRPVGKGGKAKIELIIKNSDSLLQQAQNKFSLYFNTITKNPAF